MVLVDIKAEEIKALDGELYAKEGFKCGIKTGMILGVLRVKMQEAANKEIKRLQKIKAREILGVKKKN